jgi:hypothetical protein
MDQEKSGYGYGKRPVWQWVLMYLVVGGIIYALVYYFMFAPRGYNYNAPSEPTQTQTTPTPHTTSGTHPAGVQTNGAVPSATPTPQSITVTGYDTGASIETITVPPGTSVTITFGVDPLRSSHGGLDFRSSVVNTGSITPGTTKSVTFIATKSFSIIPYWANTNTAAPYKINVVVK